MIAAIDLVLGLAFAGVFLIGAGIGILVGARIATGAALAEQAEREALIRRYGNAHERVVQHRHPEGAA